MLLFVRWPIYIKINGNEIYIIGLLCRFMRFHLYSVPAWNRPIKSIKVLVQEGKENQYLIILALYALYESYNINLCDIAQVLFGRDAKLLQLLLITSVVAFFLL